MPWQNIMNKNFKAPLRLFPVGCLSMAGHAANPKSSLVPSETLLEGAKFSFAGKGNEFWTLKLFNKKQCVKPRGWFAFAGAVMDWKQELRWCPDTTMIP